MKQNNQVRKHLRANSEITSLIIPHSQKGFRAKETKFFTDRNSDLVETAAWQRSSIASQSGRTGSKMMKKRMIP